jgi:dipeptidyl-peptidase-3
LQKQAGVGDDDVKYFLEYATQFLGNCGNYKRFGDTKFVPRADEKTFAALASVSPQANMHYKATNGAIFLSDPPGIMHLGYLDDGHITTYYPGSPTITKEEIRAASDFLVKRELMPENTRLRKTETGNFELLIASVVTEIPNEGGDIGSETVFKLEDGPLEGHTVTLVYGDYSELMALIAQYHRKAAENSENENQKNMQLEYVKSFSSGSMQAFKNSQRYWIRDKGPMVESNTGFVETYRDRTCTAMVLVFNSANTIGV